MDCFFQENKVFSCEAPYPVDMYVRLGLRKRGWVEKFSQKATASSSGTSAYNTAPINAETEEGE